MCGRVLVNGFYPELANEGDSLVVVVVVVGGGGGPVAAAQLFGRQHSLGCLDNCPATCALIHQPQRVPLQQVYYRHLYRRYLVVLMHLVILVLVLPLVHAAPGLVARLLFPRNHGQLCSAWSN